VFYRWRKVYGKKVKVEPVDGRNGINGLYALTLQRLREDPADYLRDVLKRLPRLNDHLDALNRRSKNPGQEGGGRTG